MGGGAERLAGDSTHNVSLLVEEPNETLETVQVALTALAAELDHAVALLIELVLHMFMDDFGQDTDHPYKGEDEGSQGDGAEMVAESLPKGPADRVMHLLALFQVLGEVPFGTGTGRHKEEGGCNALYIPDKGKDHVAQLSLDTYVPVHRTIGPPARRASVLLAFGVDVEGHTHPEHYE